MRNAFLRSRRVITCLKNEADERVPVERATAAAAVRRACGSCDRSALVVRCAPPPASLRASRPPSWVRRRHRRGWTCRAAAAVFVRAGAVTCVHFLCRRPIATRPGSQSSVDRATEATGPRRSWTGQAKGREAGLHAARGRSAGGWGRADTLNVGRWIWLSREREWLRDDLVSLCIYRCRCSGDHDRGAEDYCMDLE